MATSSAISRRSLGSGGSSTVTQPPYGTQLTKPVTSANPGITLRRVAFTAKDLADPNRLYQVLQQLQAASSVPLHALATSPLAAGVLLRGNVFTAGQTLNLSHGLGRPYAGWVCVRAQTNPWSGNEVALPSGTSSSQQIAMHSVNAGTFDFWVF